MSAVNRRILDFSLIVNGTVNNPPATPAPEHGMQYIVGNTPIGAFAGATPGSVARYDAQAKKWIFTKPRLGQAEVLDVENKAILAWDGTAWGEKISFDFDTEYDAGSIRIVDAFVTAGTELPSTADKGDRFLHINEGKLYTATDVDKWNSGVWINPNESYLATNNCQVYYLSYRRTGSTIEKQYATGVSIKKDGQIFIDKKSKKMVAYNKANNALIPILDSDIGDISDQVLMPDATVIIERHVITGENAASKSIKLNKEVMEGAENDVALSYGGLSHIPNVDFVVKGQTLSWGGRGLDARADGTGIGVEAGEVFIVTYMSLLTVEDEEGNESENTTP